MSIHANIIFVGYFRSRLSHKIAVMTQLIIRHTCHIYEDIQHFITSSSSILLNQAFLTIKTDISGYKRPQVLDRGPSTIILQAGSLLDRWPSSDLRFSRHQIRTISIEFIGFIKLFYLIERSNLICLGNIFVYYNMFTVRGSLGTELLSR